MMWYFVISWHVKLKIYFSPIEKTIKHLIIDLTFKEKDINYVKYISLINNKKIMELPTWLKLCTSQ